MVHRRGQTLDLARALAGARRVLREQDLELDAAARACGLVPEAARPWEGTGRAGRSPVERSSTLWLRA